MKAGAEESIKDHEGLGNGPPCNTATAWRRGANGGSSTAPAGLSQSGGVRPTKLMDFRGDDSVVSIRLQGVSTSLQTNYER
ncbi:hypothetical protein GOP47_0009727 [Adiantum capillus-veneris]|uniref:Uncharacterized protein n=1 Tax=Adiantum capillus-veneris TaxID=13818 RepID=A0A9D4UXD2_ADICA|nr:hypothetical protein GOP47_0009727 [Adiantum capillus-veneris]